MGKGQRKRHQSQRNPPDRPALQGGPNTLKLAILVGAFAVVGISFASQQKISRMGERLNDRLSQLETRLEPAAGRSLATALEQSPLVQSAANPLQSTPNAPTPNVNATVSALVGVRPVGSKMPDADRIYDFDLSGAPGKGPVEAPVTIVEFSDFQCSFCKKAQPTLARIEEVYGDQVRWVWKHLPLSIHSDAPQAHLASVAADRQDKFWEFKDKLFINQGQIKPDDLRQHALAVGLKMQQFEEDLDDPAIRRLVEVDMAEAVAIDLTATPGFFVNGRYIRGAKPFEDFATVINEELVKRGLPVPEAAQVEPQEETE